VETRCHLLFPQNMSWMCNASHRCQGTIRADVDT
jgi:hypothetical protein